MTKAEREAQQFVNQAKTRSYLSDPWLKGKLPDQILKDYEVHEWKHAAAILNQDFPDQLKDIIDILTTFRVHHGDIIVGGGGGSKVTQKLNHAFFNEGWTKERWHTAIQLNDEVRESPTHEVDCVKGRVALEIEWSNKDPFYDRDLNNFRLLFDLRAVSVGVIVTKEDKSCAF
ncbi:MAG: BglII/BstYI family type II restriction endonuclease [Fimbriimonadaceae bacterium]